ncbi:MAG: nitrilase-related carbon-nitrogen hydrolase [Desulfobacteraceae bacterium]|jgi:predicted amidohydrolase
MKVGIYQTSPQLLELEKNLKDAIAKIQSARDDGVDLVVFPELALTGYFVGPKYHQVALRMDSPEIKQLALATKGTAAIVGFIEESRSMNFYNAALIAVDGKIEYAYRKLNLPNYGVFEERKMFSGGKTVPVFRYLGFTIATLICNDLWHPALPYLAATQKADLFVTLFNSSEGSMGEEFSNIESWTIINKFYARVLGIHNICANRVGDETMAGRRHINQDEDSKEDASSDNIYSFWGGSEVIDPYGRNLAKAKMYKPDYITATISRELVRKKRILMPYMKNDDPHFTLRELNRILTQS